MNSLVLGARAKGVLAAVAAMVGLVFAGGCGSGRRMTQPNPVGFSASSLSGTYVFSSAGEDFNGAFIAVAGAAVADGAGHITGGTMDVVDAQFTPPTPVAQPITSGSYSVLSDGRGRATVTTSVGSFTFAFVLISSAHGLLTEFDGNATGSGTIDLQTSVPSLSQLAGSYAFSLGGIDGSSNSFATTGAFTLNSSGNITAGVQDFNESGIPFLKENLAGSATVGSGSGPGTLTLTANFGALLFDYYPIDATHWKVVETDFATAILIGDVFSQPSTSIPTGQMVFTMAGGVTAPIAVGGVMTSTGGGDFTGGLEDVNNNGGVSGSQVAFTGTAAAGGSVGGRVIVNLSGFVPATQWVIYPSSGGLLLLESDAATVTLGAAFTQTSLSLSASQNYGLNLSAFNTSIGVEEDDIAQFLTNSTGFTGAVDINDDTSLSSGLKLTGTTTTPDSNGRGTATSSVPGGSFVSFTYYVVNGSTVLLLETDSNQIGTGIFELQSAPTSAASLSRMLVARPGGRPHGALRRK